jgi:hypothetical protein
MMLRRLWLLFRFRWRPSPPLAPYAVPVGDRVSVLDAAERRARAEVVCTLKD